MRYRGEPHEETQGDSAHSKVTMPSFESFAAKVSNSILKHLCIAKLPTLRTSSPMTGIFQVSEPCNKGAQRAKVLALSARVSPLSLELALHQTDCLLLSPLLYKHPSPAKLPTLGTAPFTPYRYRSLFKVLRGEPFKDLRRCIRRQ